MDSHEDFNKKKAHQKRHSGRKAEKKANKSKHEQNLSAQQKNPKAFTVNSAVKAQRQFSRTQDIKSKKHHIPVIDRTPIEPPPVVVAIVGGPKVGKSTLVQCLIKNYTRQRLTNIQGPVTVIAGKKRRLTFIEVVNDVNAMIDIAKICDIALLLIDATFGIEMEAFEFLEICRQHGSPRIMGVLNHLDILKNNKALKKRKKDLKRRFEVELYPGAKLFYLSGLIHGEYLKNEVKNLGRFIAVMKFRPMAWRGDHPYVIVDRWEDITNPELIRSNSKCERDVIMYGFVRGIPFQSSQKVHIPGCGDFQIKDISFLPDPCPLPEQIKKRSLNTKERLVYAPMSGVGGVVYDKDAIYIDLGGSHHGKKVENESDDEKDGSILQPLLKLKKTAEEKQEESKIKLFGSSKSAIDDVSDSEEENDNDDDFDMEDDFDENQDYSQSFGNQENMPSFRSVKDASGRIRRIAQFNDEKEDPDGEDDGSDEEEEEMEENEPSDLEVEEEDVTTKKSTSNLFNNSKCGNQERKRKRESDESSDEDSEEEDIDAALKAASSSSNVPKTSTIIAPNTKKLRINKDADVVNKINDILAKTKATTKDISKKKKVAKPPKSEDSGISDDETDHNQSMDMDSDSGDDLVVPSLTKETNASNSSDDEESDENDEVVFRAAMFKEVSEKFYKNQSSVTYLRKFIYEQADSDPESEEESDDDDDFLKKRTKQSVKDENAKSAGARDGRLSRRAIMNDVDTSRRIFTALRDWDKDQTLDSIKNCFVTGEWKEHENAETLLKMDDEGMEIFGDVEDFESGESIKPEKSNEKPEETEQKKKDLSAREKHTEKKRRLKEMFDAEYDEHGNADYFDNLKNEITQQSELNRKEFDGMEDEIRVKYEGFRPGLYVRIKFKMFCEFVTNFDPHYPVIVGGLKEIEETQCLTRARIKVHRWFPKILKNRDPLYISIGWRRFQTLMYYSKLEDNFRMRALKYARKYLHIESVFWGFTVASNTGFAAFQSLSNKRENHFRIAATGVVLEADQSSTIVKKLKFIGHPDKIFDKTAFIKGMFNSSLEVAKVEGAKVQTQSGIRGIIKKSKGHTGMFRCTFEDSIKMSDVVILKSWAPVKIEKFCSIVRNLLLPSPKQWQGMKTVYEIKKEKNIKNLVNPDTLYTEIKQRREYIPLPMKVPRKLQAALPYNQKPKITPKAKSAQRVLVVKDKEEIEVDNFMKRTKLMMEDKKAKEQKAKEERFKKMQEKIRNAEGMKKIRDQRKKALECRKQSKRRKK